MKRILIASALALAAAAPAFAADLPPAAAPPPRAPVAYVPAAPVFSWTGFYHRSQRRYAHSALRRGPRRLDRSAASRRSGRCSVATIGGNYQIGQFVIGARRRLRLAKSSRRYGQRYLRHRRGGRLRRRQQLDRHDPWPRRLRRRPRAVLRHRRRRLRQRQAVDRHALPYGGGTEVGWTAGGGVEYAMTDNWTAKVEYLYASFQNATCSASACSCPAAAPGASRRRPSFGRLHREHRPGRRELQILTRRWRPRKPRRRRLSAVIHPNPADSAGLLFFCTIQGLTEPLYCRPKPICRLRLRVPYEAS